MRLARTRAEMKRIVDIWRQAGPELEEIRRQELRGLPYNFSDVDTLLELSDYYDGPPRMTSGLVEMQKLCMEAAGRRAVKPSVVCEEQAQYGSQLSGRTCRALCEVREASATYRVRKRAKKSGRSG